MIGYIKMAGTMLVILSMVGGVGYVLKLRSDNAILKANNILLEESVESQKNVIEQQKKDFTQILETNKKLSLLSNNLQKDMNDLENRFTKQGRDIGKTAIKKDKLIQRVLNSASVSSLRCVEIASGSPLTENEINATKKTEINREGPTIANPNYVPY